VRTILVVYGIPHHIIITIHLHADPQAVGFGEVLQHELERVVHRAAAVFAVLVPYVGLGRRGAIRKRKG